MNLMNLKTSTKKTILAMVLGLGLASSAGITVNALTADDNAQTSQTGNDNTVAQVQSITDSTDAGTNVNEKYGGCGLSCGTCSLRCF